MDAGAARETNEAAWSAADARRSKDTFCWIFGEKKIWGGATVAPRTMLIKWAQAHPPTTARLCAALLSPEDLCSSPERGAGAAMVALASLTPLLCRIQVLVYLPGGVRPC